MDYLLGKAPGQRLTECQGKPLPLDERLTQTDKLKSSRDEVQTESNFEDPQAAQELIDMLRSASKSW